MNTGARPYAGMGEEWIGAAALAGGKGYAQCRLGGLHYRRLGAAGDGRSKPAIVLLHQTPFGLAEWIDIQPLVAALGHDTIAPDNPGYGMSDPPPESVTIADLADNLADLLDELNLRQVAVAGHHTGAAIAAAFAARHPDRTVCAVLHGCPVYNEAEREARLSQRPPRVPPRADGSHFTDIFTAVYANNAVPNALSTATWATLGVFLSGFDTPTYRAVFANDMAADIEKIEAPVRVLTDVGDRLHEQDRWVASRRQNFSLEQFSAGGSFSLMLEPERWAKSVAAFVAEAAG